MCADATDCEDNDATEAEDADAAEDAEDADAIEALTESKYVVSIYKLIVLRVYINMNDTHGLLGRLVVLVANHPVFDGCS